MKCQTKYAIREYKMNFKMIRGIRCALLSLCLIGFVVIAFNTREYKSPDFSVESGFYDEPFFLEIRGGGKIYYTLDCTDPTENSILYTGPVLIDDASKNENVYSAITDISPYLNKELIELGLVADHGYIVPEKPVDKCTVVKAISVDVFGNKSEVATSVFFVGFNGKEAYKGINVISIVTDPHNLFDFEDGIYVEGIDYANWKSGRDFSEAYDYENWSIGNYRRRGDDSRRNATIFMWDKERKSTESVIGDISVQGGGARAWIPKNFNIYCKKGTHFLVFDENQKSYNLYAGGQDRNLKLRDRLVNEIVADLVVGSRQFIPCALFLEGEYWGTYHLTERFDESYFFNKYGINENNIVMIKTGYVEIGNESDGLLYNNLIETIRDVEYNDESGLEKINELIDVDSFLDYYATEIYISNTDWPSTNYAMFRSRDIGSSYYEDQRWRWLIYDVNLSMLQDVDYDIKRVCDMDRLFANIMRNDILSKRLEERMVYLAEELFEPDIIDSMVDSYKDELDDAIMNEYYRYYRDDYVNIDDFYNACEHIKWFFHERHDYIIEKYGNK